MPGGSIKILDPATFPVASTFSVALVTVEPGAMREMHWHTTSDEWTYFISGSARVTAYQVPAARRTFDITAGDVGYVPKSNAHYLENTGNTTLTFLEVSEIAYLLCVCLATIESNLVIANIHFRFYKLPIPNTATVCMAPADIRRVIEEDHALVGATLLVLEVKSFGLLVDLFAIGKSYLLTRVGPRYLELAI